MGKKGVNQRQIKSTNQSLIIHEIRAAGSLSRSELAKKLMLSAPSISSNIDDLISRGVILEKGAGVSTMRGRKPISLEFNNSYGYVVAVDMVSSSTQVALADLSGTNVLQLGYVDDALLITADVIERVMNMISDMLEAHSIPGEKLHCICIGSPGIIEPRTGAITYAPRIRGMQGTALRDAFAERFRTEVIIKNDMNCSAVGELMFGSGTGYNHFINIQLDVGTGSGLILNGKLFEGRSGAAGEIGLWAMDFRDVMKRNEIGLLNIADYHVSVFGMLSKVKEQHPDVLEQFGEQDIDQHRIAEYAKVLFDAAKSGDKRVLTIIEEGVVVLGCVLQNIFSLLDLEAVIISGLMLEMDELFMKPLEQFLNANVSKNINVVHSALGNKAVIYGAIGEAIHRVLDGIVSNEI